MYSFFSDPSLCAYKYDKITSATMQDFPVAKKLASAFHTRRFFSVANYQNKAVYLTGGKTCCDLLTSIIVFQLDSETFIEGPPINIGRRSHSSTSSGHIVAIFGGWNNNDQYFSSIEYLDVIVNDRWQFLNDFVTIIPRMRALFIPISPTKFIVCGGISK